MANANTLVVDPSRYRDRRLADHSLGHYRVHCEYRHFFERNLAGASRGLVAWQASSTAGHTHAWWCFRADGWRIHYLKYAHYAKLPPRAVFRGHILSCVVNCFIYCAILEVMLVYFNQDTTLCQWDNKAHMVCNYANQVFSSVIFFGAFGTNNMFKLYPVLPWCFLIGALLGLAWVLAEKTMPHVRRSIQGRMNETQFQSFHRYAWQPAASVFRCLNPAIALSGALNWAGNNNLTYATVGIYIAWFLQFYLKRRYTAWWGKYAYLMFAGLSVGVAISGLIVTLVFRFGDGKNASFSWWGNDISREYIKVR